MIYVFIYSRQTRRSVFSGVLLACAWGGDRLHMFAIVLGKVFPFHIRTL